MVRKTVRFTSHNQCYYLPFHTQTPPPSPTQHSPPPSSELLSFESEFPQRLLQNPLTSVHPFLEFTYEQENMGLNFQLDLSHNPNATPYMWDPIFQELAVFPPMFTVMLVCEALPWSIIIRTKPDAAITIADIFQGLYQDLRQMVTDEEYMIENFQRRYGIDMALMVRRQRPGEWPNDVCRRVDFLMFQHRLLGLSPTIRPGILRLHVSRAYN